MVQSIIITSILLFLEFELPVIDFRDLSQIIFWLRRNFSFSSLQKPFLSKTTESHDLPSFENNCIKNLSKNCLTKYKSFSRCTHFTKTCEWLTRQKKSEVLMLEKLFGPTTDCTPLQIEQHFWRLTTVNFKKNSKSKHSISAVLETNRKCNAFCAYLYFSIHQSIYIWNKTKAKRMSFVFP